MKKLAFAALALLASLVVTPAHALVVNANIDDDDTGFVVDNEFTYSANGKSLSALYSGTLDAMSKVVIEYTLLDTPDLAPGKTAPSLSSIGYSIDGPYSEAGVSVGVGGEAVSTDGLITAMAHLPTITSGTATIINRGSDAIGFQAQLMAYLTSAVALAVKVTVTSVPLPAALPLFGLGIASLAAYRSRKEAAA